MTSFKDNSGLTNIKGIKLDGATRWIGTSANIAAMDTTSACACVFSLTNFASTSTIAEVFDCATASATRANNLVGLLLCEMAKQRLITVYYDGTNKI